MTQDAPREGGGRIRVGPRVGCAHGRVGAQGRAIEQENKA